MSVSGYVFVIGVLGVSGKKCMEVVMNNFKGVIMSNVRNGVCIFPHAYKLFIVKKIRG